MPYKDPEKRKEFISKKYITSITVRIPNDDSEMYSAMLEYSNDLKITPAEFLRVSAKEKIDRDGY